ncbi:uncharacterized protein DUF3987 [Nitrosomonas nitrosa]|uniref:DUF3987 domain-containing protein n=1 Tax=Nitrosomonas nitrosa TaxID=52442 RepID=UPI000D303A15|nr:DUF3987 domain-containing protein [Nitrosomonas nitrosa]PTQ88347.1 uncharacterized protein DUF3987 [Nitrosomonas nitrosa]
MKALKGNIEKFTEEAVSKRLGKNEKVTPLGESGESGENPHEYKKNDGANKGRKGRNSPIEAYNQPVYPINALDSLAEVCTYMCNEMQLPAETAGQSLLGAASLLTQGIYDVETLAGVKPLSLNLLSMLDSGDGKSTADGVALRKISEADRKNHESFQDSMVTWCGLSKKEKESEPQPVAPYRLMKSGTIQGIVRSFKEGVSSQGSFTAEAASMLAGWGMTAEQKRNTLAGLNDLWDGAPVSIVKQGEGRTQLYDNRFCCHWMIQPSAARESLHDELLSTIGTWPRFLVAWPMPMKPRAYKEFDPESSSAVTTYWKACGDLLNSQDNERRILRLSDKARVLLIKFWEAMEQSRDPDSKYHGLKAFCVRGSEQVCRIAGVLAAFKNHQNKNAEFYVVDADVKNGIALFRYSLETWLGIFGKREDAEHQLWANDLHVWMLKQKDQEASETSMLRLAIPKYLRSRYKRDVALEILRGQGKVKQVVDTLPNGLMHLSRNVWKAVYDDRGR